MVLILVALSSATNVVSQANVNAVSQANVNAVNRANFNAVNRANFNTALASQVRDEAISINSVYVTPSVIIGLLYYYYVYNASHILGIHHKLYTHQR